jgi:hypothetical protein
MRESFARTYFILHNDIPSNLFGEKYIDTLVEYRSQQNQKWMLALLPLRSICLMLCLATLFSRILSGFQHSCDLFISQSLYCRIQNRENNMLIRSEPQRPNEAHYGLIY